MNEGDAPIHQDSEAHLGKAAVQAGFLWGLLEGTVFFVVPDVLLGFLATRSVRTAAWAWAASIAGSLAAVLVIYLCMKPLALDFRTFLTCLPGISESLLQKVESQTRDEGLPVTPLLFLTGVPLKVFAAGAIDLGHSLAGLLGWTIYARIVRMAPAFFVFAALHICFKRSMKSNRKAWDALFAVFWLVFYFFYFRSMRG